MTYLQFHFIFTIPLFALVVGLNWRNPRAFSRTSLSGMGLLLFLAISYTTPWDSYLIRENIWGYSSGQVLGTLFWIPYEEYFFFVIQTIIGCLVTSRVLALQGEREASEKLQLGPQNLVLFLASMASLLALWSLTLSSPTLRYLALIVIWAPPIALLQWSVGYRVLLKYRWTLLGVVSSLTLYFWIADSVAIDQKIWTFPENTISGWTILGYLPIEEALFFLMTNLMVVQGYILFTQIDLKKTQLRLKRTSL